MAHHHPLFYAITGDSGRGFLALSAFLHKKNRRGEMLEHRFFPANQTRQAEKWAKDLTQRKADVYVRTTPLRKPPAQGRGKKTLTLEANVLWADIDENPTTALPKLLNSDRPPSLVVGSGNGIHAYWRLSQSITDTEEIESRNRALARLYDADNCWDAAHILRVPGTFNFKDRNDPRPVELLHESDKLYDPDDFPRDAHPNKSMDSIERFPSKLQEEPLPNDFLDLIPEDLRDLIETGAGAKTDDRGAIDRSARDYRVANRLLELGWSPGQILSAFLNTTWSLSSKTKQKGPSYAIDTILSANQNQIKKTREHTPESRPSINDRVLDLISFTTDEGTRKFRRFPYSADLFRPVLDILTSTGSRLFFDTETKARYLVAPNGEVILVTPDTNGEFSDWLTRQIGLANNSSYHQTIRQGINAIFPDVAKRARAIPWCYYDNPTQSLYFSLDREGKRALRANQNEVVEVVNGSGDVIIMGSENIDPLTWQPDVDIGPAFEKFLDLYPRAIAADSVSREILLSYTLALPFFSGLRRQLGVIPILHLRGPSGEGKTETLRMLVTLIHGNPDELGESTMAAAYRTAFRQMFLPFDDYDSMTPEQAQFFLTSATGLKRTIAGVDRTSVVERKIHLPMAVTSIGEFEQEALRRRSLQIEISRRLHPDSTYSIGEDHKAKIARIRSEYWSAYALWCRDRVFPALEEIPQIAGQFSHIITSAPHEPLATSLALMFIVLREFYAAIGEELDTDLTIKDWVRELKMVEDDFEIGDPLLNGIDMLFEYFDAELNRKGYKINGEENEYFTKLMKTKDFRLNLSESKHGFYGTSTEWALTLKRATMGKLDLSPRGLGCKMRDLFNRYGEHLEPDVPGTIGKNGKYTITKTEGQYHGWIIERAN